MTAFPQSSFGADVGDEDCESEVLCPLPHMGFHRAEHTEASVHGCVSDRLAWAKPCGGSFMNTHCVIT